MDWLPLPRDCLGEDYEVPSWLPIDYDHGDCNTYPIRQGLGLRLGNEWNAIFGTPSYEFSAFLQRWLFWGLLESILPGNKLRVADHTVLNRDRLPVIKLAPFMRSLGPDFTVHEPPAYAAFAHLNLSLMTGSADALKLEDDRRLVFLQQYGRKMVLLFDYLSFPLREVRFYSEAMATQALCEWSYSAKCIASVRQRLQSEDIFSALAFQIHDSVHRPQSQPLLYLRFLRNGWCPSEIKMIFEKFNLASRLFLSRIGRPHPERVHKYRLTFSEPDGEPLVSETGPGCNYYRCIHQKRKEASYFTAHAGSCGGCPHVLVSLASLASILQSGSIPVVQVHSSDQIGYELKVDSSSNSNISYVAFSHVWSDGLGNLDQNSIPWCQFKRLSEFAINLHHEFPSKTAITHFWIDTLCVPPDPTCNRDLDSNVRKIKDVQELAISKMRETYKCANAVIVLEHWLLSVPVIGLDHSEALLRILCSPWNRRLWTLQEGALAREQRLFFRFRDSLYCADLGAEALQSNNRARTHDSLDHLILLRFVKLRCMKPAFSTVQRLYLLLDELKYRQTSVASDEPICLAVLLDLDVSRILETPESRRMFVMWSMLEEVPINFVSWTGKKLHERGFKWAPLSLLNSNTNVGLGADLLKGTPGLTTARREDEGLMGRMWSLAFRVRTPSLHGKFYLMDLTKRCCYEVKVNYSTFSYKPESRYTFVACPESRLVSSRCDNLGDIESIKPPQAAPWKVAYISLTSFRDSSEDHFILKDAFLKEKDSSGLLVLVSGGLRDGTPTGSRFAKAECRKLDLADVRDGRFKQMLRDDLASKTHWPLDEVLEVDGHAVFRCDPELTTTHERLMWCID